jgi:hypothetical protein
VTRGVFRCLKALGEGLQMLQDVPSHVHMLHHLPSTLHLEGLTSS